MLRDKELAEEEAERAAEAEAEAGEEWYRTSNNICMNRD